MLENIIDRVQKENDKIDVIGNYNPEFIDDPQKNSFHPDAMSKDQIERYGMCHEEARKFAKDRGGEVYMTSNMKHSIVVKDDKVFDYVLGYDLYISLEEYLDKIPYLFKKISEDI